MTQDEKPYMTPFPIEQPNTNTIHDVLVRIERKLDALLASNNFKLVREDHIEIKKRGSGMLKIGEIITKEKDR